MARYTDEKTAAADGYEIVHEPQNSRFALLKGADTLGEAHYTLIGDTGINFDHTFVDPSLRGTGLSGILVHRALTSDLVQGRKVVASCWFVAGYIERHPEILEAG